MRGERRERNGRGISREEDAVWNFLIGAFGDGLTSERGRRDEGGVVSAVLASVSLTLSLAAGIVDLISNSNPSAQIQALTSTDVSLANLPSQILRTLQSPSPQANVNSYHFPIQQSSSDPVSSRPPASPTNYVSDLPHCTAITNSEREILDNNSRMSTPVLRAALNAVRKLYVFGSCSIEVFFLPTSPLDEMRVADAVIC